LPKQKQRLVNRRTQVLLRDVALRAEVSQSTVSRIMRNQDLVTEATREKVMEREGHGISARAWLCA